MLEKKFCMTSRLPGSVPTRAWCPNRGKFMTEVHSDAVPASRSRGTTGHPALHTFDVEHLKKLRNTSHTLYWLAFLWGIGGLAVAYIGERMISAQGEDVSLGTFLMFYGLAIAVVGPYSAWVRPGWGRFACMALCL